VRRTYVLATIITGVITLWLLSGQIGHSALKQQPTLAELNRDRTASGEDKPMTRVRARVIHAEIQTATVPLRGRTENKRTVTVKAETGGTIIDRPVERGQRVEKGQVLCRISTEDREAKLEEGRQALNQARIEYEGSLKLAKQGLISDTMTATTKARMATAEAQVERANIDVAHTQVRAPFAGLVEATQVELGDFVQPGSGCATIIDLDPMLLVGRVAERDVHKLKLGTMADGLLIDGTHVTGTLTFIGQQSDSATRTYPVEIQVPNPHYTLRSGVTTQISIPIETVMAHRISPALLALDDEGRVGIRTLDSDNRVVFTLVKIINDEGGAVWISGLPEVATLITVGQELVVPHQQVEVVFDVPPEMPATAPNTSSDREVAEGPGVVGSSAPTSGLQVPVNAS
jgi:membrane fusion protein, multidrug efflux system